MTPRYLLDTNVVSDLVRDPLGPATERIRAVGEESICTSIVVAGELRYGAAKRGSARLLVQLEAVLEVMQVLAIEPPMDEVYGRVRTRLERSGTPIGANDLWIAAQALSLDCTLVTDNQREFFRVDGLQLENWRHDAG